MQWNFYEKTFEVTELMDEILAEQTFTKGLKHPQK